MLHSAPASAPPHGRNLLRYFAKTLGSWLETSGYSESCPVFATTLSIDDGLGTVHVACRRALESWHAVIEQALLMDQLPAQQANSRAWLIIAGLEGALAIARAQKSVEPLDFIEGELAALLPG